MGITFEVTGLDRLGVKLARLGPLFVREARALVAEVVHFAEVAIADEIDELRVVDTGRLKGSISASTQFNPGDTATKITAAMDRKHALTGAKGASIVGTVGTNVAYAIPQHEGWTTRSGREIPGRPFMAEAWPDVEALFERRAAERFGGLL